VKISSVLILFAVVAGECVFAVENIRYTPPRLCEYTLHQNFTFTNKKEHVDYTFYVNGVYLRWGYHDYFEESSSVFDAHYLFRIDLSNDTDNYVKLFRIADDKSQVYQIKMDDFQEYFMPLFNTKDRYPVYFDSVIGSTCNGKPCKKYSRSDENYQLLVDSDGFPISATFDGASCVFEYVREAPLSHFKYSPVDGIFGDVRVYKSPKTSQCSDDPAYSGDPADDGGEGGHGGNVSMASTKVLSFLVLLLSFAVILF